MNIPHIRLNINNRQINAVTEILNDGYIAAGAKNTELEKKICSITGVKYCSAVNSGASALHLALITLGVNSCDSVIMPSYICSAPLNAVNYTGAVPIITDIDKNDFSIDLNSVLLKKQKTTKAIIAPNMFGAQSDISTLKKKTGLKIIEDCAQSIGAQYKAKQSGSFGDLSVFSLYATKMIGVGYGGLICSYKLEYKKKIENLKRFDERDDYIIRYNYNLSDIQAAIAIEKLECLEYELKARRQIADNYKQTLANLDLQFQIPIKDSIHSYYRFVILLPRAGKLDELINSLKRKGIETKRPVYKPLHRYFKLPVKQFSNTEFVFERCLSLPIYSSLTEIEQQYVCDNLKKILKKSL